ncbi:hypothetical protein DXU92_09615 [Brachybacterium saurashtrense]|uniref:Uncharacterized protein n=1 Tax=Brachybacterium saurashtrense TaxID=556288 RepID=A0A345YS85_9MICO|nr:hypothetical protein DWV08_14995 [Brachybacterium saurashtrense]RRR22502.1 hypothetical protein DXU92_09615 [Brachybacterium saurashtrense]
METRGVDLVHRAAGEQEERRVAEDTTQRAVGGVSEGGVRSLRQRSSALRDTCLLVDGQR